ncbi:MAG: HAD family hydrolase [Sulfurimonas sp.]|nr:HAD family hydrolase [Sulfurimonas sp.]
MRIIIFDMDGTLIDSKKDITISVNHVRKINHNLNPVSEEFVVECINMEVRNLPYLFYETEVYFKNDRELFETHYATQCTQNPYLYDGIKELLYELKSSGYKLSVATNAPTRFANKMLDSLNVVNLFDVIIGADRVSASKPSPEMLDVILNTYGFDKSLHKAWMIGDNIKDIKSAKNANIKAIFATWGFTSKPEHNIFATKPKEILDIVM